MHWWIYLASVFLGMVFLYLFVALCVHICKYGVFKGTSSMVDKTIFITGGTSGIGRVTVNQLYLKGFKITFTGRNSKAAHEIVKEITKNLKNCK